MKWYLEKGSPSMQLIDVSLFYSVCLAQSIIFIFLIISFMYFSYLNTRIYRSISFNLPCLGKAYRKRERCRTLEFPYVSKICRTKDE